MKLTGAKKELNMTLLTFFHHKFNYKTPDMHCRHPSEILFLLSNVGNFGLVGGTEK